MTIEQPSVACGGCEIVLAEPTDLDPARRAPCPECGALTRIVKVHAADSITLHEQWRVVHRGQREGVRGRRLMDAKVGDSQSHDGTWAHMEQLVDSVRRRYRKLVVRADGRVTRDVDIPLEHHRPTSGARTPAARMESDPPGWTFQVEEVSAHVFQAIGCDESGQMVERVGGPGEENALNAARHAARAISEALNQRQGARSRLPEGRS